MRRVVLAVLCALALAGCGGGGGTSASGRRAPAGAAITPADSLAFVAVDTDQSSDQWKQADALLTKFPIRDQLLAQIDKALSDHGVDFSQDVLPAVGTEVDLAVVKVAGSPQVAAMTQPKDASKLDALLAKGDRPAKHARVGDWTVFSDNQGAVDAVQNAGAKLADDGAFKAALATLPSDANVKAFVNGPTVSTVLKQAPADQLQWASFALSSQKDGWKLSGAFKSTSGKNAATYSPTLLGKVPSGSLLVASFKGSSDAFAQLRNTPGAQAYLGQLQRALGVTFEQLTGLVSDEGVFFVQKSIPYPEATLILKEKNPSAAMATLNTLAARAVLLFHCQLTDANAAGTIKKLSVGSFAIYYGIDGGTVVISDFLVPIGRAVRNGETIERDPLFTRARDAVGLPAKSAGFLYVNVKDAIPVVEALAQLSGASVPPALAQNLAPLQSFVAYATSSGGVEKFSALLQVR